MNGKEKILFEYLIKGREKLSEEEKKHLEEIKKELGKEGYKRLLKGVEKTQEEIEEGKVSPTFESAKDVIAWLSSEDEEENI